MGVGPNSSQELQALRESEERFRSLCAAIAAILFETNTCGCIIGDIAPWCAFTGQAPEQAAAQHWTKAVHPEDRARILADCQVATRNPGPCEVECRLRRADGAWRWMRVTSTPMRDATGTLKAWAGMMTDITDAHLLKQELLDTRRRFELALANSPVTLLEQDLNLHYRWVHNAPREFPADAIIGRTDAELLAPEAAAPIIALKRRAIASGQAQRAEVVAYAPGYRPAEFDLSVEPRRDAAGAIIGVMSAAVDITARKRAEAALRTSEERFRQLFEQSADGIFVADAAGRYVDANPAGCAMFGYTRAELLTLTFVDVISPDEIARLSEHMANLAEGDVQSTEWRFIRRDRTTFVGEVVSRQLPDGRLQGIVRDVTERRRAEDTLRAVRDTFVKLVDRSPFGVFVTDRDLRIVQASVGARKAFAAARPVIGRDLGSVLRKVWREPDASAAVARFRDTLATGEPYRAETTERGFGTEQVEAHDWQIERIAMPDGQPGLVCHFYDLTERRRQEEYVQLLVREVSHRAKNILQLVDTVARRTAATQPRDFVVSFSQRIRSLGANLDLLVNSDWRPISLEALIRAQLAHFGDLLDTQIIIAGPPCHVTPSASPTLAMAVHELATNAAKYGALSNDQGRVEVRWDVRPGVAGASRFSLAWTETGGPPVSPPAKQGFGTTVTGQAVRLSFNGKVTSDFAPAGFSWRMNCPGDAILDRAASARLLEAGAETRPTLDGCASSGGAGSSRSG